MIAAAMVGFVVLTALHSTNTAAKLARFSIKLGFAILIAAMIRVRAGLPYALSGFQNSESRLPHVLQGISIVMFYVAPLAFLASTFGNGVNGRRQLAMTGFMGLAVPLFVVLMMIGVTNVATFNTSYYQPSLNPNIGMALLGKAARSYLAGPLLVIAVGMFGALRFGLRLLAETVTRTTPAGGGRIPWIQLIGPALAITWLSLDQVAYDPKRVALDASVACLVSAAAVLTADFVVAREPHANGTHRVD